MDRPRDRHVLSWAAIGLAGASLVAACLLPGFVVAIEAYIGAGATQRAFRYEDELAIAGDLPPFGLLPLGAGLLLVALAGFGLVYGSRAALVVAAFSAAVALGVLVLDTEDRLEWPGAHGVIGYGDDHSGPLLGPGLDGLHAAARRSPEAGEPGWALGGGEHGYAARGLNGWRLFVWSTLALLWLTAFRLARLRFRPLASALLVAAASAAVLVWLFLRALSGLE